MNGWHVGISAVGLPLAELASRYGTDPLPRALQAWQAQRKLDFLLVMTTHGGKEAFRRELGVVPCGDAATALLPRLVRPRDAALSTCVRALNARGCHADGRAACLRPSAAAAAVARAWMAPAGRRVRPRAPQGLTQGGAAHAGANIRAPGRQRHRLTFLENQSKATMRRSLRCTGLVASVVPSAAKRGQWLPTNARRLAAL